MLVLGTVTIHISIAIVSSAKSSPAILPVGIGRKCRLVRENATMATRFPIPALVIRIPGHLRVFIQMLENNALFLLNCTLFSRFLVHVKSESSGLSRYAAARLRLLAVRFSWRVWVHCHPWTRRRSRIEMDNIRSVKAGASLLASRSLT
jgi:hypothetical protein